MVAFVFDSHQFLWKGVHCQLNLHGRLFCITESCLHVVEVISYQLNILLLALLEVYTQTGQIIP